MGRPSDAKIDVLVSFISAAYARSVGRPATGSWSDDEESALERIIEDIFANLGIDGRPALEAGPHDAFVEDGDVRIDADHDAKKLKFSMDLAKEHRVVVRAIHG